MLTENRPLWPIHSERRDWRLHSGKGTMQINWPIHSERDANHIAISVTLALTLNLTLTVNGPLVVLLTKI